jgi:hypothetical protein
MHQQSSYQESADILIPPSAPIEPMFQMYQSGTAYEKHFMSWSIGSNGSLVQGPEDVEAAEGYSMGQNCKKMEPNVIEAKDIKAMGLAAGGKLSTFIRFFVILR